MKWFKSSLLVLGMTVSMPSSAASVTLFGDDISFTFDDASLFGTGIVVGNSLIFQPSNFKAESLNGAGTVPASETLIIDVAVTTAGFNIESLGMFEQGDYIVQQRFVDLLHVMMLKYLMWQVLVIRQGQQLTGQAEQVLI